MMRIRTAWRRTYAGACQGRSRAYTPPSLPVPPKSRPRPCFQTNFVLAPHESKIETMRRFNENVQRAGKKLLFSNRIEDVENIARK